MLNTQCHTYYNSNEVKFILENKIKYAETKFEQLRYKCMLQYICTNGRKVYKLPLECDILKEVYRELQKHIEIQYLQTFGTKFVDKERVN